MPQPSQRALDFEKLPDALKSDTKVIIENTNRYLIDMTNYDSNSSFYIQQSVANQNPVNKILTTIADTLFIRYVDFLGPFSDNNQVKYALYLHSKTQNILVLDNIKPFFDLTNEAGAMVSSIIKFYRAKQISKDSLYNNCFNQVYQAFGKPATIDFRILFNQYYYHKIIDSAIKPNQHGVKGLIKANGQNLIKPGSGPNLKNMSAAFSLRQFVPPVGNQGSSGSCTAWATAYGARSVNYNILHAGVKYAFSPEFIYNQLQPDYNKCIDGSLGITAFDALTFMEVNGNLIKTDRLFNCQETFSANDMLTAAQYKIVSTHPLFTYSTSPLTDADVNAVKLNLSQLNKPVAIAILLPARKIVDNDTLYTSFDSLAYPPNSGIWQPSNSDYNELADRGPNHDSHSVCIIGYNDNINGGSFEILNSWSEGWGAKGYLWLNYDDFKKFAFDGYVIDNIVPVQSQASLLNTYRKKNAGRRPVKQN